MHKGQDQVNMVEVYTFDQFVKSLQIISIKTTAFMLKLDCL